MTYDVNCVYEGTDDLGFPCIDFDVGASFIPGIAKHNVSFYELRGTTLIFMQGRLRFNLRTEDVDLVRTFMIALSL